LERLTKCNQDIAEVFEVIVTDDGAKSSAEEMVRLRYPSVKWVEGPHRGPAANRNCGARLAKGEWLVFLDDDCLPEPGWLKAIVRRAGKGDLDVVEGQTLAPGREDNPFKYYVENPNGNCYWSCNLAIRRQVFEEIGAFDEDFLEAGGEDIELADRIRKAVLRTTFDQEARVIHPVRIVSWNMLIWRTFMQRWTLLYHLKTGVGLPLNVSDTQAAIGVIKHWSIDLLRTTWHVFSKHDRQRWRTQLFNQIWKWFSFPLVLPYLIIWEIRFRRQLRLKKSTNNTLRSK
jgi:GT2 family glycosyltransferase